MNQTTDINYLIRRFSSDTTKVFLFCYLDIDNFQSYNIRYGYERGNSLLNKIKHIISHDKLESFLLFSKSDEFLLCFEGSFEKNKNQILDLLNHIYMNTQVTVSVGATYSTRDVSRLPLLFQTLRNNVSVSKQNGKNKIYID